MKFYSFRAVALVLLGAAPLAACSSFKPPEIDYDDLPLPAALQSDPPQPVKIVAIPKVLPMPGQLKSLARGKGEPAEPTDPKARIEQANAAGKGRSS
jgi:type IV secretion system protein VirB9